MIANQSQALAVHVGAIRNELDALIDHMATYRFTDSLKDGYVTVLAELASELTQVEAYLEVRDLTDEGSQNERMVS